MRACKRGDRGVTRHIVSRLTCGVIAFNFFAGSAPFAAKGKKMSIIKTFKMIKGEIEKRKGHTISSQVADESGSSCKKTEFFSQPFSILWFWWATTS
ncbi:hypothetical protein Hanom_Chr04g00336521 [Helianthus anomalus]